MEILLIMLGIILILGMSGLAALLAFVILPKIEELSLDKAYPVQIPEWKLKINEAPFFQATIEDISNAITFFANRVSEIKGYKLSDVKNRLNEQRIAFVRPANPTQRYIVDAYGRKIAGDHQGDKIRVVALSSDRLNQTAFFHELAHAVHRLENRTDYDHTDKKLWVDVVEWCKKNFV